ncbi:MAG: TolC family protein [Verrucomicrobia bacterium]|nr:TolC family protein [Verrucomicrobiota bacterium]
MGRRSAVHGPVARTVIVALLLAGTLALPASAAEGRAADDRSADEGAVEDRSPLELSIEGCIALGIKQGLDYLTEEEDYILQQLSTSLTRHSYGRIWSSTVSAGTDSDSTNTESASVQMAKRLLTGGEVQVAADTAGSQPDAEDNAYSSSVEVSLTQPLLRGAGRLAARENLTQAERDFIYAWRDLTLFKQEFLIELVAKYYRLVQLQLEIGNRLERVASAEELAMLTLARLATGTASRIDMLRAVVNLLRARNDLVDAGQRYELQLDSFKLDLDLAMDRPVTIVPPETLPYRPMLEIRLELPAAIKEALRTMAEEADTGAEAQRTAMLQTEQDGGSAEELGRQSMSAALENRLDLRTARDQADDARRGLRLARNDLRGDLNLRARAGYTTEPETSFDDQRFGQAEWSVGLEYALPLDRVPERLSYQRQLIVVTRALRQTSRVQDRVLLEVRTTVRELHRAETTVLIQQLNVVAAERRLERARADYDLGEITNRDVVEAQTELLDARNALDQAKVDHIIATLQLQKDTGELDFDRWRELIQ